MTRRVDLAAASSWGAVVEEAAEALRRGDVVVLPAEGLYGYHVRADDPAALAALQRVKPREEGRGWIVLLPEGPPEPSAESPPDPWRASLPSAAAALARAHWPGALTLVVPAPGCALPELTARDGTIALRSPGSAFLQSVLLATGCPLVSTSANRPGEPPPSRFEDCRIEGVALAVDAGPLSGLPSTVARVDGSTVEVLRSGALKVEGEAP
ncbi:MAG TPA: Sua5/YciO/YrdC/YwlC family protein [Candidatus Eisenbacteria bacterium]|nr:Sua5/YciO/YrdC/YwlC family protein [Candidatus Eisenbacteria bacterium]